MKKYYWFKNTFKAIVAVLCTSLFITAIVGGISTKTKIIANETQAALFNEEAAKDELYTDNSSQVINVLLIGTDDSNVRLDEDARADSITIVSANLEEITIKMVSIERSITVPIEEIDGEDWITHVFRYSGAKGVVKSVEEMFDLQIDKYIRVNLNSYKEIIDTLGGVDLKLTLEESKAIGELSRNNKDFELGENRLDGSEALSYARLRSIDNNYERMSRQKNVIKAIAQGARDSSITELIKVAAQVMPDIETNFTLKEITELITNYNYMLSADMQEMTLPGSDDIVGGDHTADGRILTKINIPIVKQKLHYYLYNINIEVDPEEVAMYENYESQYNPLEVWEADPHQDVLDYTLLDEPNFNLIAEEQLVVDEAEQTTKEPSVSAPEITRGRGGVDNSSVIMPTEPTVKNNTMTQTFENTPTAKDSSNTTKYNANNLPRINYDEAKDDTEDLPFRSATNGETE